MYDVPKPGCVYLIWAAARLLPAAKTGSERIPAQGETWR